MVTLNLYIGSLHNNNDPENTVLRDNISEDVFKCCNKSLDEVYITLEKNDVFLKLELKKIEIAVKNVKSLGYSVSGFNYDSYTGEINLTIPNYKGDIELLSHELYNDTFWCEEVVEELRKLQNDLLEELKGVLWII